MPGPEAGKLIGWLYDEAVVTIRYAKDELEMSEG